MAGNVGRPDGGDAQRKRAHVDAKAIVETEPKPDDILEGEAAIIACLRPLAAHEPGAHALRDDCASLTPPAGHDLVVKTDPIRAGLHFFATDAPADLAWKALAVNVSDLIAKGADPWVYTLALALPASPRRAWMEAFADGLREAQAAFGFTLIGGDTDRVERDLSLAITVIGLVPQGQMVRRGGGAPGDRIYVSGRLGASAAGLMLRQSEVSAAGGPAGTGDPTVNLGLDDEARARLIARYLRPAPTPALASVVRSFASGAMDISDGLIKDLERMCKVGGFSARIDEAKVPLDADVAQLAARDPTWLQRAMSHGDDYEVLAVVAEEAAACFEAAAAARDVEVAAIGHVLATPDGKPPQVEVTGADGSARTFERSGWDHF
ncbi:MAG: thiamine-phosphate kinase [Pseudomonadota bacterium]